MSPTVPADLGAKRHDSVTIGTQVTNGAQIVGVGLIGIVTMFVGIAVVFALQQPPYYDADEKAHVAYAHEVAGFHLPEIATPADPPASAVQWRAELDSAQDDRYRTVWVANHPPLDYVLSAPIVWWSTLTDRPDGGLLLLRFQNIVLAAVGVVFTFLLGRELARSARLALVGAAIVALVPQGYTYFSRALNDGLAFAAGTAVVWAGLRCLRRGAAGRELALLSGATVVATGARAATMLVSIVVVGAVLVDQMRRSTSPWRDRLLAALRVGMVALGPAALLWGWFYLRNIALYGDIGASQYLLERFSRSARGSVVDMLRWGEIWGSLYHRLATTAPLSWPVPRFATLVAVVGVIGLVVTVGAAAMRRGTIELRALVVCLLATAVVTLTVAQHLAGGGSPYPRYFFPALGVAAVLLGVSYDRLGPRVLPLVLLAVMGMWMVTQVPRGVDPVRLERPRDRGPAPVALQLLPAGDTARLLAATLAVLGAAAAAVALVTLSVRRGDTDEPVAGSDGDPVAAGAQG